MYENYLWPPDRWRRLFFSVCGTREGEIVRPGSGRSGKVPARLDRGLDLRRLVVAELRYDLAHLLDYVLLILPDALGQTADRNDQGAVMQAGGQCCRNGAGIRQNAPIGWRAPYQFHP